MAVSADKIDMKKFDFLLRFSSPVFKRVPQTRLETLYAQADAYGAGLALKYSFDPYKTEENAREFGVLIIPYNEEERSKYGDKAYYDPGAKEIHWNSQFPAYVLKDVQARCRLKDENTVAAAVLTHEFFHHIEEHSELPADEYLSKTNGVHVNPVFREIAAFSFTNVKLFPFCSQYIDLFQLKIENPNRYEALAALCRA